MKAKHDFEIPYVIGYRGEVVQQRVRFAPHPLGGVRLSHWEPTSQDWHHGILRARMRENRVGRPDLTTVNIPRQWRCMEEARCQACARPARDRDSGRVWWLLSQQDMWPGDSANVAGFTNAPPTCLPCIPKALSHCPHLRRSAAVYSVGKFVPYGVIADIFEPHGMKAQLVEHNAQLRFDSFHVRYALASQLLVVLDDVVPVPWEPLAKRSYRWVRSDDEHPSLITGDLAG